MYFDYERTLTWARQVAEFARQDEALQTGEVGLFVLPDFVSMAAVVDIFADTPISVGAQDIFWDDDGAYTGEISGPQLRGVGSKVVLIGHAERKRMFGETAESVALKSAAALRNGLVPIICVGESSLDGTAAAIQVCIAQLENALTLAPLGPHSIVVAYEPEWAIGAQNAAEPEHIRAVCDALGLWLQRSPSVGSSWVIYGGSAGPGLLSGLGSDVNGLFLGRFAHDPEALRAVVDEAAHRVVS